MFMLMYSKPINERSQFGIRVMASLDPLIERGYGYPLLYQSGELFKGQPIHDRQHPHDLIAELAPTYMLPAIRIKQPGRAYRPTC